MGKNNTICTVNPPIKNYHFIFKNNDRWMPAMIVNGAFQETTPLYAVAHRREKEIACNLRTILKCFLL